MAEFISPASLSPRMLAPLTNSPTLADAAKAGKVKAVAQQFESQFLAQMLGQMFEGVDTNGPFGGGFGEEMFRSLMTDELGKQMTKAGGIGLADTVQREILKMQGLK